MLVLVGFPQCLVEWGEVEIEYVNTERRRADSLTEVTPSRWMGLPHVFHYLTSRLHPDGDSGGSRLYLEGSGGVLTSTGERLASFAHIILYTPHELCTVE